MARILGREPGEDQLGQASELRYRFPHCEYDPDLLGVKAASDERQRLRRSLVQPLGVIDQAQHRPFRCGIRQPVQDRQTEKKRIRRIAGTLPERDPYRIPLRIRKQVELLLDHLREHLMQSGEREFGLRFHPGSPDQRDVIGSRAQILKQRRLPDARLAPKDQGAAAARPDVEQQLAKSSAFPLTVPQGYRRRAHRSPRIPSPASRRPFSTPIVSRVHARSPTRWRSCSGSGRPRPPTRDVRGPGQPLMYCSEYGRFAPASSSRT